MIINSLFVLFLAVTIYFIAKKGKLVQTLASLLSFIFLWTVWPALSFIVLGLFSLIFKKIYSTANWLFIGGTFLCGGLTFFWPQFIPLYLWLLIAIFFKEIISRLNLKSQILFYTLALALLVTFYLSTAVVQIFLIFIYFLLLALTRSLVHFLYQETDMIYARSLDQMMANYVQELNDLYAQIRGWRHDYHNHLQTLSAQLQAGQVNQAQNYLAELAESLGEIDQIVKSGNTMLDAVVNSKLTIATRLNIPQNVKVFVGSQTLAHEVDLVVILGNLLDNAIEANAEIPVLKERLLRVYIGILEQQLYISVTNARPLSQAIKPDFASTKNDKRGLGIRRVNTLVANFHGLINRQYEEGFFVTEVLLPLENISK
ncbi:sensor histidine kinase [Enterococcus timonensis]|uniref:sensor histidine kinase n=1 Tax=Enterococcus timonensis TaxID=1852364 RepID=UPI000AE8F72B|nr:GHKL domain-containing protein [Enterococcus timonensis]